MPPTKATDNAGAVGRVSQPAVAVDIERAAMQWALEDAGIGVYALPCDPRRGRIDWAAAAPGQPGLIQPLHLQSVYLPASSGMRWALRRWVQRSDLRIGLRELRQSLRSGAWRGKRVCRVAGGLTWRWIAVAFEVIHDGACPNAASLLLKIGDVSDEQYARIDVELVTDRLRMALQAAQMGMYGDAIGLRKSFTPEGARPGWQLNAAALYGLPDDRPYNLGELVDRLHPDDRQGVFDSYRAMLGSLDTICQHEYRVVWPDGTQRWLLARAIARIDPASGHPFSTGVVTDITDRKIVEQRITHLANHDSLTGLPSRKLFREYLQSAIKGIDRPNGSFALMFIDLDRFKVINDTLGHAAGDQLLLTIASRFTAAVRRDDLVARLGGDEFVVLASDVQSPRQAEMIARKLLEAAREPVVLAGQECHVGASIGICLAPAHGVEAELLLQRADVAMYQAKEQGRNKFQVFDEQSPEAEHRLRIELQLANALERGEFHLVYQPQVDAASRRVRGVEALLRWNNPVLGSIPPAQFIPIAEEMGVISQIGAWVMEEACRQAQAWALYGLPRLTMAVNVSAQQFRDPGFYDMIRETLKRTGLDPSQLEIEITESAVVRHSEAAIRTLTAIRALSVKVALDDFGTGHSSLSQLRILPLDVLKIDRSFVHNIHRDEGAKAIAQAIAVMGKALGLEVVAEGMETDADADYLRTHTTCDVFQGYLFGRPISADEMLALLSCQANT